MYGSILVGRARKEGSGSNKRGSFFGKINRKYSIRERERREKGERGRERGREGYPTTSVSCTPMFVSVCALVLDRERERERERDREFVQILPRFSSQ